MLQVRGRKDESGVHQVGMRHGEFEIASFDCGSVRDFLEVLEDVDV